MVTAAKRALDANENLILPYAPKEAGAEIKAAFQRTLSVGKAGGEAAKLADHWFFETVVRLHREWEVHHIRA